MKLFAVDEGRDTLHLIPLGKTFDGKNVVLNATRTMAAAIESDAENGYFGAKYGPNYAIERRRAEEYAQYVADHVSPETVYRFSTDSYSIALTTLNPGQQ